MAHIDPVTLVVVQNGLQQIATEMDLTFERAAFSPVISEGFDRSDGIYAKDNGDVIAQGLLGLPIFVGVMQFTTRAVIEHVRDPKPGDIFLVNDPYAGGTHLMDVKMVKPYFYRGRHWAFLSNTGHWPDTGGSVPGGFSTRATEVQQEGLRLPPVRLFREGVMQDDILSIVLANIRVPEERIGDIKAQVAALTVGEKRLTALLDRYGEETVSACIAELRRRSEQMMRGHIAKIPDGVYTGEAFVDSDGVDPDPLAIRLTIRKEGTDLHFDFSDSSPPCRGPLNAVIATTRAAVYLAIKHIFPDVPINAGMLRAAADRGPARDVSLRALPPTRLRVRRGSELAHRRVRLHDARARDPRRPLRRARRDERQPHARRPRPDERAALHHVRVLGRRVRRQPRRRRAHQRVLDHRDLEDAADGGARAALSGAVRAVRAARALRRRGQDARRVRRRLPDPHPARRGAPVLPDGPRALRPARPVRGARRGEERGGRVAAGQRVRVAAPLEGRGYPRPGRRRRDREDAGRRRVR